jgi:hypothetical protein
MGKITLSERRCKRCTRPLPAAPAGGLCALCAQFWKVVNGIVVKK